MLTAEASVETERPSRYLGQLCRHFNQKGRHLLGGLRAHLSGDAQPRADLRARIETIRNSRIDVEWSETHGIVSFGWGQCTMQAGSDTLTLRAQAADEENLLRVQDLVAGHLARFGRRDHLTVNWQRPSAPSVQPGEDG
jgi:hypothetical protein